MGRARTQLGLLAVRHRSTATQDKTRQNTVTSLRRAVYKLAVTIGNDFIHAVLQVTCSCANPICKYLGLLMLHTNARCMRLPTG